MGISDEDKRVPFPTTITKTIQVDTGQKICIEMLRC